MFIKGAEKKHNSKKHDFVENRSSWQGCYFLMRSQYLLADKGK